MTNIGFDQSIYDNIAASTNLISGDDYKKLVFNIYGNILPKPSGLSPI